MGQVSRSDLIFQVLWCQPEWTGMSVTVSWCGVSEGYRGTAGCGSGAEREVCGAPAPPEWLWAPEHWREGPLS